MIPAAMFDNVPCRANPTAKPGRAKDRQQGGDLNAELAQRSDDQDDEHGIACQRSEDRFQGGIDMLNAREQATGRALDPASDQIPHHQDD
jgi:hypothetical protein